MLNDKQISEILSKCIIKDIMTNFIYTNKEKLKNEKTIDDISDEVETHLKDTYLITKGTDLYTFIEDIVLSINPRKIRNKEDVRKIYYNYRNEFINTQYELSNYVKFLSEDIYDVIDKKINEEYIPSAEEKFNNIISRITTLEEEYENTDKEEKDIISVDFSIIDNPKYDSCKDAYKYDLSKKLLMERISNDLEKEITNNGYKNLKNSENIYDTLEFLSSYEDIDALDVFYSRNSIIQLIVSFKDYHAKSDKPEAFLELHHSLGRIDKSYVYLNNLINTEPEEGKESLKDVLNEDYDSLLKNMECVKNLLFRGYCFMNLLIEKDYKNILILKYNGDNIFTNIELQSKENIKNEDILEYINYMNTSGHETLSMITLDRYTRTMENMVFDNKDYKDVKMKQNKKNKDKLKNEIRNILTSTLGNDNKDYVYNIMTKIRSDKEKELNLKGTILDTIIRKDEPIRKYYKFVQTTESKSEAFMNFYLDFMKEKEFIKVQ